MKKVTSFRNPKNDRMVITNVLKSKCGKILKTLNDTFEEMKKLKEKILENSKDLRD